MRHRIIGFDIGGTKCTVTLAELEGEALHILGKRQLPTDHGVSAYEMIDRMYAQAVELGAKGEPIGISCGGPLDAKRGLIQSPPNLPGWDEIKIVEYLRERYGAQAYLENDANACAVAEWLYGAGRGCKNMVFLTFGTGMGAGLILNGALYAGTNGNAGEIGHVRMADFGPVGYGKAGSFEGFCSGGGLAQLGQTLAREKLQRGEPCAFAPDDLREITAKDLALHAQTGDEDALRVFAKCGEMLGKGLSILVDILNPERIVLGSIYQRSDALLEKTMCAAMERECLRQALRVCRVVPAELKEELGDYAALCVAVYAMRQEEKEYAV